MTPDTPTKIKNDGQSWIYSTQTYNPTTRKDLTPIFELVADIKTQPSFGQKSYYGRKRHLKLIKADL